MEVYCESVFAEVFLRKCFCKNVFAEVYLDQKVFSNLSAFGSVKIVKVEFFFYRGPVFYKISQKWEFSIGRFLP